jgi:hypothetical protein
MKYSNTRKSYLTNSQKVSNSTTNKGNVAASDMILEQIN